jgi:hypothetical protein
MFLLWFLGALIIALVGLVLNTRMQTSNLNEVARENRAIDAALEAAINSIRMDPTGVIGSPNPPCWDVGVRATRTNLSTFDIRDGAGSISVDIDCTRLLPDTGTAQTPFPTPSNQFNTIPRQRKVKLVASLTSTRPSTGTGPPRGCAVARISNVDNLGATSVGDSVAVLDWRLNGGDCT